MPSIEYSIDALNTISKFYKVDAMVYVEGDDDVVFWDIIFSKYSNLKIKIQAVGGSEELEKHIPNIINGSVNSIIAKDSDYLELLNMKVNHPRIIYSYGYSIENTLFTIKESYEICKVSCRKPDLDFSEFENWHSRLLHSISSLIVHDLANEHGGSGVFVLGDNCSRFMVNQNSHIPCNAKINTHLNIVTSAIPLESRQFANLAGLTTIESINRWVRGHFLTSAIQKYVCNRLKEFKMKPNLSTEQLYTNSIFQLKASIDSSHPHRQYYNESVLSAVNTF